MKDTTDLVTFQKHLMNNLYLEAIEQNYSHEQITPLITILGNSKIVYNKLIKICLYLDDKCKHEPKYRRQKQQNQQTFKFLKTIAMQGQIMMFHNKAVIEQMKIRKRQAVIHSEFQINIEQKVHKVIEPFELMISQKEIEVFIQRANPFSFAIKTDWAKYQLILFNIFQNAVKFNCKGGSLIIILRCLYQSC